MSQPKKLLKDYFTEDFHTPNTEEVREYLEENFETISLYSDRNYISPSTWNITGGSCFQTRDTADGKFIDTETFKEIIGMTNKSNKIKSNKMPELVAGRHFVKLKSDEYAMVMDGYINYVTLGNASTDLKIIAFDPIVSLNNYEIVEVFDPIMEYSKHFNQRDFDSGKYTIWKKQEKTQQQIELEALGEQIAALQKQYEALKQASSE